MAAIQVPDPKLKYQQLLAYGKKLPPMPQEDHTDENKVRGCVSQVKVLSSSCVRHICQGSDKCCVNVPGLSQLFSSSPQESMAPASTTFRHRSCTTGLGEASSQRWENLLACRFRLGVDKGTVPLLLEERITDLLCKSARMQRQASGDMETTFQKQTCKRHPSCWCRGWLHCWCKA